MLVHYEVSLARFKKPLYIQGMSDDGIHFMVTDILDEEEGKTVPVTEMELKTIELRGWQTFYEEVTEHAMMRG